MKTLFVAVAATVLSFSAFALNDEFRGVSQEGYALTSESSTKEKLLSTTGETVLKLETNKTWRVDARIYAPANMLDEQLWGKNGCYVRELTNAVENLWSDWSKLTHKNAEGFKWEQEDGSVEYEYVRRWFVALPITNNFDAIVNASKTPACKDKKAAAMAGVTRIVQIDWNGTNSNDEVVTYTLCVNPYDITVKNADDAVIYATNLKDAKFVLADAAVTNGMALNASANVITITNASALVKKADGKFYPKAELFKLQVSTNDYAMDGKEYVPGAGWTKADRAFFAAKSTWNLQFVTHGDYLHCTSNENWVFNAKTNGTYVSQMKEWCQEEGTSTALEAIGVTPAMLGAALINGRNVEIKRSYDFNQNGRYGDDTEFAIVIDPTTVRIAGYEPTNVTAEVVVPVTNDVKKVAAYDSTNRVLTASGDCLKDRNLAKDCWYAEFDVTAPSFASCKGAELKFYKAQYGDITAAFKDRKATLKVPVTIKELLNAKAAGIDIVKTVSLDWDGDGAIDTVYTVVFDTKGLELYNKHNFGAESIAWPLKELDNSYLGDHPINLIKQDAATIVIDGVTATLEDGKSEFHPAFTCNSSKKAEASFRIYIPSWADNDKVDISVTNEIVRGFFAPSYTNDAWSVELMPTNTFNLRDTKTDDNRFYYEYALDLVKFAAWTESNRVSSVTYTFTCTWDPETAVTNTYVLTLSNARSFTLTYADGSVAYPLSTEGAGIVSAGQPIVHTNGFHSFFGGVYTNELVQVIPDTSKDNVYVMPFTLKLPEQITATNFFNVSNCYFSCNGEPVEYVTNKMSLAEFMGGVYTNAFTTNFVVLASRIEKELKDRHDAYANGTFRLPTNFYFRAAFDFDCDGWCETFYNLVFDPHANTLYRDVTIDTVPLAADVRKIWPAYDWSDAAISPLVFSNDYAAASGFGEYHLLDQVSTTDGNEVVVKINGTVGCNYNNKTGDGDNGILTWYVGDINVKTPESVTWSNATQVVVTNEFDNQIAKHWSFDPNCKKDKTKKYRNPTNIVLRVWLKSPALRATVYEANGDAYVPLTYGFDWNGDGVVDTEYLVKVYLQSTIEQKPAVFNLKLTKESEKQGKDVYFWPAPSADFRVDFSPALTITNYVRTVTNFANVSESPIEGVKNLTLFEIKPGAYTNKFESGVWQDVFENQQFAVTLPNSVNTSNWSSIKVRLLRNGVENEKITTLSNLQAKVTTLGGTKFVTRELTTRSDTLVVTLEDILAGAETEDGLCENDVLIDFDCDGTFETAVVFLVDTKKISVFRDIHKINANVPHKSYIQVFPKVFTNDLGIALWKQDKQFSQYTNSTCLYLTGANVIETYEKAPANNVDGTVRGLFDRAMGWNNNDLEEYPGTIARTGDYLAYGVHIPQIVWTNEVMRKSAQYLIRGRNGIAFTNKIAGIEYKDQQTGVVTNYVMGFQWDLPNAETLTRAIAENPAITSWSFADTNKFVVAIDWEGDNTFETEYTIALDLTAKDHVSFDCTADPCDTVGKFPITWNVAYDASVTNFYNGNSALVDALPQTWDVTTTVPYPTDSTLTNQFFSWKLSGVQGLTCWSVFKNEISRGFVPAGWDLKAHPTNTITLGTVYVPYTAKIDGEGTIAPLWKAFADLKAGQTLSLMQYTNEVGVIDTPTWYLKEIAYTNNAADAILDCGEAVATKFMPVLKGDLVVASNLTITGKLMIGSDEKIWGPWTNRVDAQIVVEPGATLTLSKALVQATTAKPAIVVKEGGALVIEADSILAVGPDYMNGRAEYAYTVEAKDNHAIAAFGEVLVKGQVLCNYVGTMLDAYPAVVVAGEGELTLVEGAEIMATNGNAIAIAAFEDATLNLLGGVAAGSTAVYFDGGKLNIPADSTVQLFGLAENEQFWNKGLQATGEALIIDSDASLVEAGKIVVDGGKFAGSAKSYAIASYGADKARYFIGKFAMFAGRDESVASDLFIKKYERVRNTDPDWSAAYPDAVDLRKFTLSYELNGGEETSEAAGLQRAYTVESTEALKGTVEPPIVKDNVVSKKDWYFKGWYFDEKCLGTQVKDFTQVVEKLIEGDYVDNVTVYAKWTETPYTAELFPGYVVLLEKSGDMKFDHAPLNDVYVDGVKRTVEAPLTVGFDVTNPQTLTTNVTCAGYTFLGWYDEKGTRFETVPYDVTDAKDYKLYATWSINTYSITYVNDWENGKRFDYTVENHYTFDPDPMRDAYLFQGWTADGTKIASTEAFHTAPKNLTVTANWTSVFTGKPTFVKASEGVPGSTADFDVTASKIDYAGYIAENGRIVGQITVNASKAKADKPSTVRVTILPVNGKKIMKAYKINQTEGKPAEIELEGSYGWVLINNDGIEGCREEDGSDPRLNNAYTIVARPIVKKTVAQNYTAAWTTELDGDVTGSTTLRVALNKSGKASIAGVLFDGTKFSVTSQGMSSGTGTNFFPVVYNRTTKGITTGFAALVKIDTATGAIVIDNPNVQNDMHAVLVEGAKDKAELTATACDKVATAKLDYLTQKNVNYTVGGETAVGTVQKGGTIKFLDPVNPKKTLKGVTLSYAYKTGALTGKFVVVPALGAKAVNATVAGVMVSGKVGYATATYTYNKEKFVLPVSVEVK